MSSESRRTRSQISASIMRCAYERISDENFLCTCNHGNAIALANARCCRHALSDPAMSCVRRHRLYPDSGTMRDRGAVPSPQAIPGGGKAAVLLLLSMVLAADDGRCMPGGRSRLAILRRRLPPELNPSREVWFAFANPAGAGGPCALRMLPGCYCCAFAVLAQEGLQFKNDNGKVIDPR